MILARHLTHAHLLQFVKVISSETYAGILRHVTHSASGVQVFITSSDNAVIVCSLRLDPDHEITFPGATK